MPSMPSHPRSLPLQKAPAGAVVAPAAAAVAAAAAAMTTQTSHPHPHPHPPHRPYVPTRERHYLGPPSSSSASLKGCCCCLFLLLTFLALLTLAAALVIALVVKPKPPTFDLNQVAVQYLLVSPTAATTAYLSLNITLLFTAANPNKVGIRYAPTLFYVMYRGVPLGTAAVAGFEQAAHSMKMVMAHVEVTRFDVMQADALELVRDAAVNDRVELRITGDVGAKIRFLGVTSPKVQVSVYCAIVISPRRQALTYKQCGVDGLNV